MATNEIRYYSVIDLASVIKPQISPPLTPHPSSRTKPSSQYDELSSIPPSDYISQPRSLPLTIDTVDIVRPVHRSNLNPSPHYPLIPLYPTYPPTLLRHIFYSPTSYLLYCQLQKHNCAPISGNPMRTSSHQYKYSRRSAVTQQ